VKASGRFLLSCSTCTTRNSKSGFTLLEVLVALTILAVSVAWLLQLCSSNLRAVGRSAEYMSFLMRADGKLREIAALDQLSEGSWQETASDGMRTDIIITNVLTDKTDSLQVKMLEITVRVYWKRGPKGKTVTLTTTKLVPRPPPEEDKPQA
jgi:general secretion pathway protein I